MSESSNIRGGFLLEAGIKAVRRRYSLSGDCHMNSEVLGVLIGLFVLAVVFALAFGFQYLL
jgi:hypothetical protein